MLFCLLLTLFFASSVDGHGEWDKIRELADSDAAKFKEIVSPIVQVAANAYRYPNLKPVPGWTLAPNVEPLAPVDGGHALVYQNRDSGAIILAFRGTDLASQADLCADQVLFNDSLLDTSCDGFSSATLDYFSQATSYTRKVLEAYPEAPLLVTGHSLGAALAILVSSHFAVLNVTLPVVSFSAPPMRRVLERNSLALGAREIYVVGDEWDFIMLPRTRQVGVLCLYETVKPQECGDCHSLRTDRCFRCFVKTHMMRHVIDLVDKSGKKPFCKDLSQINV